MCECRKKSANLIVDLANLTRSSNNSSLADDDGNGGSGDAGDAGLSLVLFVIAVWEEFVQQQKVCCVVILRGFLGCQPLLKKVRAGKPRSSQAHTSLYRNS